MLFAGLALAICPGVIRSAESIPLRFTQIDLTDGRQLKNVVIRSYDARTERLLIVADKTAMTIPISLLPAPFNEKLKAAPASGASVSTALSLPRQVPPAPMASSESERANIAVPATPAPEITVPSETPIAPPPARPTPRPRRGSDSGEAAEASPTQHQFVARTRANRYYRYEHQVGSNSISVTALEFEFASTQPVPGWTGRCRTEGKAFIEYFDSKGRSFQRTVSTFEVLTEQKPGEEIKVIEFSRKS